MSNTAPLPFLQQKQTLKTPVLPIEPELKKHLLTVIGSVSANAKTVSALVQQDPALCLMIFHHANKQLAASTNESCDLIHAISLLGFANVGSLIKRSPVLDKNFVFLNEYRQALSVSLHAANQLQGWAAINPNWPKEALYWACLFHYSPLWGLWAHAGQTMSAWQRSRAKRRGATHPQIEQTLFGTSLLTLCAQISQCWHLPSLSQQCWLSENTHNAKQWITLSQLSSKQQAITQVPALQKFHATTHFAISLANRFAESVEWHWMSAHSLRLQAILATTLNCSRDKAIQLTHQLAAKSDQQQTIADTFTCAVKLLSRDDKAVRTYFNADNNSTPPQANNKKPIRLVTNDHTAVNQHASFEKAIAHLRNNHSAFNNIDELMNFVVTTLCINTMLDRAVILMLNLSDKQLNTADSFGCENAPPLKSFCHTLQRGDLFTKLLQKPGSLRINNKNREKIFALLPTQFKTICASDEFFMMSLFADKQPIALLYADTGIHHQPLDDAQYKAFKTLSHIACQCLASLYNNNATKPND